MKRDGKINCYGTVTWSDSYLHLSDICWLCINEHFLSTSGMQFPSGSLCGAIRWIGLQLGGLMEGYQMSNIAGSTSDWGHGSSWVRVDYDSVNSVTGL